MDGSNYSLSIETRPETADVEAINRGLKEFNDHLVEDDHHQELAIILRDTAGQLAGGLLGDTF